MKQNIQKTILESPATGALPWFALLFQRLGRQLYRCCSTIVWLSGESQALTWRQHARLLCTRGFSIVLIWNHSNPEATVTAIISSKGPWHAWTSWNILNFFFNPSITLTITLIKPLRVEPVTDSSSFPTVLKRTVPQKLIHHNRCFLGTCRTCPLKKRL